MSLSANFPAIRPSLLLDFANTKALDPRITFTRNTTATYYDGVTTAMAEQNLLTYSQEFDNAAWSSSATAITRTANTTTAPDGTTTADSWTADGTTAIHYSGQLIALSSTATYALSFYAKANGANYVQAILGATTGYANFDITTGAGAVGTSASPFSSLAIQDVGNGWFRCSCLIVNPTASNIFFVISNSASATRAPSFLSSSGIFLWGAQLEQRSSVTAYTATTTQPITNYIPVLKTAAANVARFDHNPTTDESLGLLIEEQRTNLLTYSEQFDNATWAKTRSSITANTVVAPDGTLTGDKLVEDTTVSNSHVVLQSISSMPAGTYTATVYAKAGERTRFQFAQTITNPSTATFNLSTGAVVGTLTNCTATITLVGNGWYRCSITYTTVGTQNITTVVYLDNGSAISYTGDGYSGIYIWGAQLEAGAFATSYIPTVATTVQRNADSASMTGTNFSSWYNAGEGSVCAEATTYSTPSYASISSINASAVPADNRMGHGVQSNNTNLYVITTATTQVSGITSGGTIMTNRVFGKSAYCYKVNDFAISGNGAAVATDTSGLVPVVNQMLIGNDESSRYLNGYIKKIAYYPIRVTNAQLQALTS